MWDIKTDKKEKALLVIVDSAEPDAWSAEDSAGQLRALAGSCGITTLKEIICRRSKPTAAYFIGRGKAEEIASLAQGLGADAVIFNDNLSSTQQRNLEQTIAIKTIDRTQLILDIFAQRAKSAEGKVQVELAQLEYLLPRLAGEGIILSRLGGGIGTRGPGEQKLEVDRRRVRERIGKLKQELKKLSLRRSAFRVHRERNALVSIAIVGYTNAGKSTLLNYLTGAHELVRNSLFSTLDSVARRCTLPNKQRVLFSDTVGFLQRLPHQLVEAFKATLEEVEEADLLLHVLDASSPLIYEQNEAVHEVLRELNAERKPMVVALNKIDLLQDEFALKRYLKDFANSVPISALHGTNMDRLLERLSLELDGSMTEIKISIPQQKAYLLNTIYREGKVLHLDCQKDQILLHARLPQRIKQKLDNLLQKNI